MTIRLILITLLSLALSGCTTVQKTIEVQRQRLAQEDRLESAVKHLEQGDAEGAAKLLQSVVTAPGVPGVTDEALFRLALLTVPTELEQDEISQAAKLFDRLQREYPTSPWSTQSTYLADFLSGLPRRLQAASELRRQVKTLKDLNLSLTRENKELRLNIEKLKILDVELERKK